MSLFYQRECFGCGQPCDGNYCYSCTCPRCGLNLLNGSCNNCIYGNGKPVTCSEFEGMLRGGFCLSCDLKDKNSYNCDPNAYSCNNSNHFPQPQYENYLCNLCESNSHDGYDCQQQFSFVHEQEPSYNQNYNDNYYSHDLPSFSCCDNCEGSLETFQCQPNDQNVDFFGSDQIQIPQYPEVHPPSQEINDEVFQAKGDLMKSIQTFLKKFNYIPFEEKPKILLEAWYKFFAIQQAQHEDSNELFQKLLEDLKELAEYDNSPSRDRSTFFNDDENHYVQNKESLENSSNEIAASNSDQEKEKPPQDSNIRQLIREECYVEICEEQKQKIENTILELVEICRQKELFCTHDNVEDLIESVLISKLLSINSNSQRLDKKEQEVKNIVEQPAEPGTRVEKSLQNFRVIHKSSISLNNTSQISSVHATAPILSNKEPEHSLSMGYEHLSITPETESDEATESNAKNLLLIPSECEVTSENESKCDMPAKDDSSPALTTFSNPLFNNNDNLDSSDNKSLPDEDVSTEEFKVYSNPLFDDDEINSDKLDPHCFNLEYDFVESLLNRDTFIIKEFSEHNAEEERIKKEHVEYIIRMEMLFTINPRPRPTVNVNTIVESLPSLPIPVQDGDSQREEIDIVTNTDELLPSGFENDDTNGEIDVFVELQVNNSISNSAN
nr:hypothetical protein [Tanacetum cinerariifolium]